MATKLFASHLKAGDVVGRFIEVEGQMTFEEDGSSAFEAYVASWVGGGGYLFDRGAVKHELIVEGMRRVLTQLLCAPNVGVAEARPFREIRGVPAFVARQEQLEAECERASWGSRCGGGPQLEVTVFGARNLDEDPAAELQLIARTLSFDAKAYAKELAPAIFQHRAEFRLKTESAPRDWARAAARSPEFSRGGMTVAAGVEWVRTMILDKKIDNPDKASPKDKVKLAARGNKARTFVTEMTPRRMVFATRVRGTRLKIELKQRSLTGMTSNVGGLDIVVDDIIDKNQTYDVGWLPLTQGRGELQVRFYYLDPDAPSFDPANLRGLTAPLEPAGKPSVEPPATKPSVEPACKPSFEPPATKPSVEPPAEPSEEEPSVQPTNAESRVEEEAVEPASKDELPARPKPPPPPPRDRKPPPPPPRRESKPSPPPRDDNPRPSLPMDLASQLKTGASGLHEAPEPRPSLSMELASQLKTGASGLHKAPEPRPSLSIDLASQLKTGASGLHKAPAPEPRPSLSIDLASQLKKGASGLRDASTREMPSPLSHNNTLFDVLAARISAIRTDVRDLEEDDDDDDVDDW